MRSTGSPRSGHAAPAAGSDATVYEPQPPFRRLRGYAFDPSLSLQLDTAVINEVTFRVLWEPALEEGPIGEYLEVIDYDPASGCFYAPVDLNDRFLLAQDGLPPSEGDPRFHQQFVYAVAMTTIRNFERALGRRALWSPLRGKGPQSEQFVRRLRVYPHALREANAYYSPEKRALLFGYFPAAPMDAGTQFPGGTVFTCLSHDIVAHETSHALLDGMHRRFIESTHPDGLAFHEAFADIIALFQHFSFPEVLRHQIARKRGDLASQSLLGELAQEFGRAIGRRGALRDALGDIDEATGNWQPRVPNPEDYNTVMEPHDRGAILVGAVFDAFLSIYRARVADLFRIASEGTGVLPAGAIHPDLVERLAQEAAKSSQHVLTICIRALDYCPPVDLTFGEYLRALITADAELVPDDDRHYRLAFIEAFRRRGIYPRDVRSLSIESLRWQQVADKRSSARHFDGVRDQLRQFLDRVARSQATREEVFESALAVKRALHGAVQHQPKPLLHELEHTTGLVIHRGGALPGMSARNEWPTFEIHSVRPARRAGPNGDLKNDVVIVVTQWRWAAIDPSQPLDEANRFPFRGGCTLVLDLDTLAIKYVIRKRITSVEREQRQREYLSGGSVASLRATYFGPPSLDDEAEPFAILHRGG